jgi:hypothetical protein
MVLDGSGSTPWVENAEGYGVGEWLDLDLGATRTVTRLEIANGYGKDARYRENGRVRSLTLRFSGGESRTVALADRASLQRIDLGSVRTSSIRLIINSVYEGSRWPDTAVGDVRVIGY